VRRLPPVAVAAVFACVVALDQAVKVLVRATLVPGVAIPLVGTLLQLRYVRNVGAAFGMLPGHKVVFMLVAVFVVGTIAVYVWRIRPTRPLVVIALGLVSGGAVGNLIDRAFAGRVTDFLELPNFPVFNVADSAIVVGTGLLVWWLLFGAGEHPAADPVPVEDVDTALTDGATPVATPPAEGE
jgi:signal peptidase II